MLINNDKMMTIFKNCWIGGSGLIKSKRKKEKKEKKKRKYSAMLTISTFT